MFNKWYLQRLLLHSLHRWNHKVYLISYSRLYHKDLTNSIETIKWTNRKIIQLFNIDGTCVAIDDENILYYGVQKINLTKDVIKGSKIIHA